MRFDSGFLTKAGNVGMQVVDGHDVFSVYRNQYGQVITSEQASKEQKKKMIDIYLRKEPLYKPKKAIPPCIGHAFHHDDFIAIGNS